MKRTTILVAAVLLAGGAAVAYHFAHANGEQQPAAVGTAAATAPPGIPSPFGSGPAAPAVVEQPVPVPQPAPPSAPPPSPAPVPAPIAKALAAARAQAPNRTMTQLAKNWFGCASEDGYNTTLNLIRQKNASASDHFHGPDADCAPLPSGTHIAVMRLDGASGIAQISIDETHKVYWTDTEALAGDPARK